MVTASATSPAPNPSAPNSSVGCSTRYFAADPERARDTVVALVERRNLQR
jgi:hypothetical protein